MGACLQPYRRPRGLGWMKPGLPLSLPSRTELVSDPPLRTRILERLSAADCEVPLLLVTDRSTGISVPLSPVVGGCRSPRLGLLPGPRRLSEREGRRRPEVCAEGRARLDRALAHAALPHLTNETAPVGRPPLADGRSQEAGPRACLPRGLMSTPLAIPISRGAPCPPLGVRVAGEPLRWAASRARSGTSSLRPVQARFVGAEEASTLASQVVALLEVVQGGAQMASDVGEPSAWQPPGSIVDITYLPQQAPPRIFPSHLPLLQLLPHWVLAPKTTVLGRNATRHELPNKLKPRSSVNDERLGRPIGRR